MDDPFPGELEQRLVRLLSPDEADQRQRFATERLANEYLATRALCRLTLSRYADVAPNGWRFKRNRYGRPEIESPPGIPPLRFNLSNTHGLVACLVTLAVDAGIDVEDMERRHAPLGTATELFSADEAAALASLPADQQRTRFFEYWTLKESYIKARGLGLSLPLQQFTLHLGDAQPIRISFAPGINDSPSEWQFGLYRPSARHVMAVAIKRGARPDLRLEIKAAALAA
ncbi:MAG: 4'-phosphopantetheinyl transferase superfamily protein [Deltaproteobacteria bacterium]|nr:4'-phosphopantetheinyl transferase superfamily protein [Deltaproteobacteria bacterium]